MVLSYRRCAGAFFVALVVACGGSVSGSGDGGMDGPGGGGSKGTGGSGGTSGSGFDASSESGGGADGPSAKDSPSGSDTSSGADSPVSQPYDGVVGNVCTTDADCATKHGPNLARCSNTQFGSEDYYPTAVCVLPTCSPVSGTTLHFCDGPDDPSSPGICVPDASGSSGSICLPKCSYDDKGGAAVCCHGHDRCFSYSTGTSGGVGYCWGGCKKDGDCQDGQKCQADLGLCLVGAVPPTKKIGAACTSKDTATGACNCFYGSAKDGYCTSVCTVGDAKGCPSGFVCDSIEYRSLGYSTPNPGMGGYCAIDCSGDAAACPASSSCTNALAAGPDCIPP